MVEHNSLWSAWYQRAKDPTRTVQLFLKEVMTKRGMQKTNCWKNWTDNNYTDFCSEYGQPKAIIFYSWIIPCYFCTLKIKNTLESPRFAQIPDRVVAYTTDGTCAKLCDKDAATEAFANTNIVLTSRKYDLPYYCKYECKWCYKYNCQYYCEYCCEDCYWYRRT